MEKHYLAYLNTTHNSPRYARKYSQLQPSLPNTTPKHPYCYVPSAKPTKVATPLYQIQPKVVCRDGKEGIAGNHLNRWTMVQQQPNTYNWQDILLLFTN
jgi:hypothetical protein